MAGETSLEGEITTSDTTGSASQPPSKGPENIPATDRKQDSKKSKAKDQSNKTVPFHKLFSYADSSDRLLMFVGVIAAVANGMSMPLLTITFGDVIDAFGSKSGTKEVVHGVSKVITV